MATDLSLLPLAQLKKLAQQHGWNSLRWPEDGGDTWEDARGAWAQRSYPCSFCGREFRSAQALGGHMNVHRRDRARLRQAPRGPNTYSHVQTSHATMADSPSTLLSMSLPCPPATDPPRGSHVHHASLHVGDGSEMDELDLELRLGW